MGADSNFQKSNSGKRSRWEKVFKIETGLELLGKPIFGSVVLPGSKV